MTLATAALFGVSALLVLALLQLLLRWGSPAAGGLAHGVTAAIGAGLAAGFATMWRTPRAR